MTARIRTLADVQEHACHEANVPDVFKVADE
jgi:hypothetical protein